MHCLSLLINTIMQKLIKTQNLPQSVGGKPNETQEPDKQALPPLHQGKSELGRQGERGGREREGGRILPSSSTLQRVEL